LLEAASSSEMAVNMVVEQGGVPFRRENTSFETANRRGRGCAIRRNLLEPTKGPSPIESEIVLYSRRLNSMRWCGRFGSLSHLLWGFTILG
jgi:hypothetical protein